jgi:hypothetical protein
LVPKANLPSVVNTHEVCFAVDQSIESGKPVALPLG